MTKEQIFALMDEAWGDSRDWESMQSTILLQAHLPHIVISEMGGWVMGSSTMTVQHSDYSCALCLLWLVVNGLVGESEASE